MTILCIPIPRLSILQDFWMPLRDVCLRLSEIREVSPTGLEEGMSRINTCFANSADVKLDAAPENTSQMRI
jgi:hypothetical protein